MSSEWSLTNVFYIDYWLGNSIFLEFCGRKTIVSIYLLFQLHESQTYFPAISDNDWAREQIKRIALL